ncbi:protein shisa-4-like isoform X1 [Haliotis rubra]|uniref:protein shisa-4-like isoform X1 n=2 Tax=Haliotis rubra TaxID=36100 RepID=UPI001EE591E8|nr:protein shisa-4-like isoform X1 [Haliotis rubra]
MNIHCFVGVSVLLFGHLVSAHGVSYCHNDGMTFMCSYGCCGDSSQQYCCSSGNNVETTATVALIIGIVCSAVLTIVVIVGFVMCCVRCCKSSTGHQGHQGQVVTTGQLLAVLPTTGSNTTPGAYNAGYVYPPQPAPGTHYTQPAGTAQPPPSYPHGPVPAYPTETGQAKATSERARTS